MYPLGIAPEENVTALVGVAMTDGTFFSGSFSGRWRREGTQVVCRYIDLVSNGDMSLYIVRFDATQDEMAIEHHKFV